MTTSVNPAKNPSSPTDLKEVFYASITLRSAKKRTITVGQVGSPCLDRIIAE
eukprot:gene267-291_t